MPLSCPRTEQPHYFKISVIHIQTGTKYFFQIKCLFSLIADCRRSCYGILIPKDRIPKHHLHSQNRIPCQKTQCNTILLISPCCRKSRKFRLSFLDLIPFINQFACSVTGHTSDTDRTFSVISHSTFRILHRSKIQIRILFSSIHPRSKRSLILSKQISDIRIFQFFSII